MPAYEITMTVPIRLLVSDDNRLIAQSSARNFIDEHWGKFIPEGYPVNIIESQLVKEEEKP